MSVISEKILFLDKKSEILINKLIQLLKPFEKATVLLSDENANLITADLVLTQLVGEMHPLLIERFRNKVLSRRNTW